MPVVIIFLNTNSWCIVRTILCTLGGDGEEYVMIIFLTINYYNNNYINYLLVYDVVYVVCVVYLMIL